MSQPSDSQSKRRAKRKRLLHAELCRWYQPGLRGLALDEARRLDELGYGRWLRLGRLTAEMVVALIDDALLELEAVAEDRVRDPAAERQEMASILEMTVRSRGEHADALRLLADLLRLNKLVDEHGGPHYILSDAGAWRPAPEAREIADAWCKIQEEYPVLINRLRNQVFRRNFSEESLELGNGHEVILGERPPHEHLLRQLKVELGDRYLAEDATLEYRCARVRKWKEQALTRQAPR
jgi:hypothetical protein